MNWAAESGYNPLWFHQYEWHLSYKSSLSDLLSIKMLIIAALNVADPSSIGVLVSRGQTLHLKWCCIELYLLCHKR